MDISPLAIYPWLYRVSTLGPSPLHTGNRSHTGNRGFDLKCLYTRKCFGDFVSSPTAPSGIPPLL